MEKRCGNCALWDREKALGSGKRVNAYTVAQCNWVPPPMPPIAESCTKFSPPAPGFMASCYGTRCPVFTPRVKK